MTLNLGVPQGEQHELKPRITVFGIGGAGGNAVDNMIAKELQGVEFVTANTDAQALQQSRAQAKIQMGVKATEGLGAGAKAEIGAAAAEETIEEIVDHLAGAHMCFITAGMGGGTGTGAAPIIAQAARELGVLTVGVVTKPFQFEGAKRMRQAEAGVERLQSVVDTLIVIPNQNLFRLANEKTTFTEAFSLADDVLYQGVKGVTDLMVRPGIINLDFADVRSVMDEMGKAMMGTGEADGEERAIQAAEKAIANPLLDEISLKGAKGVLINITGGHDLTLFELDEAANRIREEVDPDANIIVGSTLDDSMEGRMRVSVVATGIDVVESARETPRPARRPTELRAEAELPAPEPVAPAPVEAPAPAPEHAFPPAAQAREAEEDAPSLFGGLEDQPEPAQDDALPPPAYAAARAAAARRPGEGPDAEALNRLQAAVSRARPETAATPAAPSQAAAERSRFGIGSLINRMSGHGGDVDTPRPAAAAPPRPRTAQPQAPQPRPVASAPPRGYEDEDADHERIEIPAFLRRQAN